MATISPIQPPRRTLLKGLGAAATLNVFPHIQRASAADAIEQSTIEITGVHDPQLGAQLAIAEHYGYFKDAGLDATIHWNQSAAIP
jgi:ABC-type nitrate/sulfonate/bicarbonate transport system substrate-binding protein